LAAGASERAQMAVSIKRCNPDWSWLQARHGAANVRDRLEGARANYRRASVPGFMR
jgi:hypothetical protein